MYWRPCNSNRYSAAKPRQPGVCMVLHNNPTRRTDNCLGAAVRSERRAAAWVRLHDYYRWYNRPSRSPSRDLMQDSAATSSIIPWPMPLTSDIASLLLRPPEKCCLVEMIQRVEPLHAVRQRRDQPASKTRQGAREEQEGEKYVSI
ncbi:hypothetical protein E2C01_040117 [Portunus trituberculatus]|uniref:Uncharacterized protein n=1 Tax=Portunus trituberculatus TaxID=210409 RepID=A0A5B7FLL3_PORTR|nr:hypothetical protein [Portunus trituberculatus]